MERDVNKDMPRVTILMPVYNGEKYIREAIDSILGQTFADFEFLIINDGSTDGSVETIESYHDPRIRLVHNKRNLKLIATLNRGLELARGEYIVRMDCDDISLPERLEKQVEFMDQNPEVDIAGTGIEIMDGEGKHVEGNYPLYPTRPARVWWKLFFWCCINHPTVVMRRSMIGKIGGYSLEFPHAEDYELWLRTGFKYKLANLPDVLLKLRKHNDNISQIYNELQLINSLKAVRNALCAILKRDVSIERARDMRSPHLVPTPDDGMKTSNTVCDLVKEYINREGVSRSDADWIKDSAGKVLGMLAITSFKSGPFIAIQILLKWISIRPLQPFKLAIQKAFSLPNTVIIKLMELKKSR